MAEYLANNLGHERFQAELAHPDSQFFVAERGEKVVGYLKLNHGDAQTEPKGPEALEIERIYVLQQYHGTQVGALLYQQALSIAQARNAPYIWLGVWEENPRAIRFYQKQGFVEFGEHIFQLGDDAQRDVLMKLELRGVQNP